MQHHHEFHNVVWVAQQHQAQLRHVHRVYQLAVDRPLQKLQATMAYRLSAVRFHGRELHQTRPAQRQPGTNAQILIDFIKIHKLVIDIS